jgi:hypothetical protein
VERPARMARKPGQLLGMFMVGFRGSMSRSRAAATSAPAKFGIRPCGGNGKRATPSARSLSQTHCRAALLSAKSRTMTESGAAHPGDNQGRNLFHENLGEILASRMLASRPSRPRSQSKLHCGRGEWAALGSGGARGDLYSPGTLLGAGSVAKRKPASEASGRSHPCGFCRQRFNRLAAAALAGGSRALCRGKEQSAHLTPTVAVPSSGSAKRRSGCIVKAIAQPESKSAIDTAKGKIQLPVRSTIRPKASGDTIAATADLVFITPEPVPAYCGAMSIGIDQIEPMTLDALFLAGGFFRLELGIQRQHVAV